MKNYSVDLETANVEYSTEADYESSISKENFEVKRETRVTYEDFIEEETLPITIFSQELSPLQAIVKFLKEYREKTFSEIARCLNRDPRTIWSTYNAVESERLEKKKSKKTVPLKVFKNRELSTLEVLVQYLRQNNSISEIASLLDKNYQTIWTVKRRVAEKGGEIS